MYIAVSRANSLKKNLRNAYYLAKSRSSFPEVKQLSSSNVSAREQYINCEIQREITNLTRLIPESTHMTVVISKHQDDIHLTLLLFY